MNKSIETVEGHHYTLDFKGCTPTQLESEKFWKTTLHTAAETGKLEVVSYQSHKFNPVGITGFLLLGTSHISFHTWPEHHFVACDVYSCASKKHTKLAVEYLSSVIEHTSCDINYINREPNL